MSYVVGNPRSKKQIKDWLKEGKDVLVFEPGLGSVPDNGTVYLEGPHYPEAHKWYASGEMRDGKLVKVK